MLRASDPGRIVTLGGDCSVSVVPFTYLAAKYGGDVAYRTDDGNVTYGIFTIFFYIE